MLTNVEDSREKVRQEVSENPAFAAILRAFDEAPARFEVVADASGLELAPVEPEGARGRCRMKLFRPPRSGERLCAFFYKRSNLAWSRERFSYGGVEFRPEHAGDLCASWLAWLEAGFPPSAKPERLRRAFLYDIPD